jgi:hypothetical protein
MALDPRLASPQLLALAALRLRQKQQSQLDPFAVCWLDEYHADPTEAGDSPSGVFLPRKAASVEAWLDSPLVRWFRDHPGQPWEDWE